MNQILVSEKVYVTEKLKKKKRFYKLLFIFSILAVIALSVYYVYTEYDKRKWESISQDLLQNFTMSNTQNIDNDNTVANETLVIALDEEVEVVTPDEELEVQEEQQTPTELEKYSVVYTTQNGTEYKVDAILNIPTLEITYPVISTWSDELLKISLNKFWGGEPNSVGNYCIVGHNYDGKDIFFGKLDQIQNGDIVELEDKTGTVLKYKVYNKFIVDPTDVACTSQLTNGKKEMTLITCSDRGKTRLIVKCRAVE